MHLAVDVQLQGAYKVLLNQMVLNLSKLARTPASIPDQVPCQLQSSVIPFSAIFMAILSPPILLNSVVEVSKVLNQVVAPGSGPLVSYPLVGLWYTSGSAHGPQLAVALLQSHHQNQH